MRRALLLAGSGFCAAFFGTAGPSLQFGSDYFDTFAIYALFVAVGAALLGGLALLAAALPWKRRACLRTALLCGIFVSAVFLGLAAGDITKMNRFRALARSAAASTLVAAIDKYQADHGYPPTLLTALVPQYLPSIPSTGMGGYPAFGYRRSHSTDAYNDGNTWRLEVQCGGPLIDFDGFLYLPNQNYPPHGRGGGLERMGRWAYLHD